MLILPLDRQEIHQWIFFLIDFYFLFLQEEETGFITGLGDYIRANAPYARDMGPARYDDYYKAPWATSREFEERHKRISAEVGASLKGSSCCLRQKSYAIKLGQSPFYCGL